MIGLSLDNETDAPRKFVNSKKIPWTQGFLGNSEESQVARDFNVEAIPAVFLIDPDGKLVAKELRGDKIKKAVAKALSRR